MEYKMIKLTILVMSLILMSGCSMEKQFDYRWDDKYCLAPGPPCDEEAK